MFSSVTRFFTRPIAAAEEGGKRELLLMSMPLILGMAADTIMLFTDRIFLANHSDVSFQAAMPTGILSYLMLCIFHQVALYAGTFVAHYHGAKSPQGCLHATAQGLWLSVFSVPFLLALMPLGLWIISHSSLPANVIPPGRDYFLILMLGGLRLPAAGAISGYFTGKGLLKLNTIANLTGALLNIPLDYLFIFGYPALGIPEMGIRGAAWATVISGFAPFFLQFYWYLRSEDLRLYGWRPAFRLDFPLMRRIIRFGVPSGFQVLVDVGAFTVFVFIVGGLGGLELSVSTMCFSVNHLAFAPLMGFGIATSIVVARYQGARQPLTALRAGWSGLKVGWGYMIPLAIFFVVAPQIFIMAFNPAKSEYRLDELLAVARPMMLMMAIWGIADTANIVLMSALRGAGDTKFVMICMLVMGWVVWMPVEWLALRMNAGLLPMWAIMTVYIFILAVIFAVRWKKARWMTIQVIEPVLVPQALHTEVPQE